MTQRHSRASPRLSLRRRLQGKSKRHGQAAGERRLRFELLDQRCLLSVSPVGAEFQVNTYTTGEQFVPKIASDAAGDSVVVWSGYDEDGSGRGVFAQRYNAAGVVQGSEFQVNTYTALQQAAPVVAMDASGNFVVAWQSTNQDGDDYGVYAQRYNAAGAVQGSEFRVNTYTTGAQMTPAIAMDAAGDFVITWSGSGSDPSNYGVYGQRYSAAGATQGSEFQVNTTTSLNQQGQSVAMDAAGDFVVTWESTNGDGSGYGILAQRFNAAGAAQGGEFQVNTYTTGDQFSPSVAMDAAGDFAISWGSAVQEVDVQLYNAAGAAQGGQITVTTTGAGAIPPQSIAMDSSGDFVITFAGNDSDGFGVFAQDYNSSGTAVGSAVQVNTYTTSTQTSPAVAMDALGDFTAVWQSLGQDGSVDGIYGQRFTSSTLTLDEVTQTNNVSVTFTDATHFTLTIAGNKTQTYSTATNTSLAVNGLGSGFAELVFDDNFNAYAATESFASTTLSGGGFAFSANSVKNLYIYSNGNSTATVTVAGTDPGNFYVDDVADQYSYIGDPTTGYYSELSKFKSEAVTGSNGSTYAYIYSTSGAAIVGDPSGSTLTVGGATSTLGSFLQEYVVGAVDGTDTVTLHSSGGTFVATPQFSYVTGTFSGNTFLLGAIYAASVTAQAAGGADTAVFTSYAGNTFTGAVGTSTLTGATTNVHGDASNFSATASGFLTVSVFESGSGTDVANLTSPGSGTFVETVTVSTLTVGTSKITVNTYTQAGDELDGVPATVNVSGQSSDVASLYDAPLVNTLTVGGSNAKLVSSYNTHSVTGFGSVTAYQQNSTNDTVVRQSAIDFALQLVGVWRS